jgi:hypothetical protein
MEKGIISDKKMLLAIRIFGFLTILYGGWFLFEWLIVRFLNSSGANYLSHLLVVAESSEMSYAFSLFFIYSFFLTLVLSLVVPVLTLWGGIGILRLENHQRRMVVLVLCVNLFSSLISFFVEFLTPQFQQDFINHLNLRWYYFVTFYELIIVIFFSRKKVRQYFE